jgi:hypothetical protein
MSYLKMLGLITATATALVVLGGTAIAATLTAPQGTTYTSSIQATAGNLVMHGNLYAMSCKHSSLKGKIETHGAGVAAGGALSSLTFSQCNSSVTVKRYGSLKFHSNGTVTSTDAEIVSPSSMGECVYTTSNTVLGTLAGGSPGVLSLSAIIPRTGGSLWCGSSVEWTGSFTFTTPGSLWVD